MQLLYIGTFLFYQDSMETWALPSCADSFFAKYLDVFDSVRILGEKAKSYLDKSAFIRMQNPKVQVRILPANTHPGDFINDRALKKALTEEISRAEAILVEPTSRRGIQALAIADKLGKPYMIELVGDIHNALKQSSSLIKRLYATILYRQIRKAIRNCPFGLYVSREYLQKKYPIVGKMCGCADVVLEPSDPAVLAKRMQRIDSMKEGDIIHMALVGFYQGNGKGVDTALRAMSRLPERFHLTVLGNGTEESRQKWYAYAREHGVAAARLHFYEPLSSSSAVQRWLDDYDFFIFPTRSEGLPRVVVEAMSRGLPCFASNMCSLPELLQPECLFELDDDRKLAALLQQYSADKELMKQTAQTNYDCAWNYDSTLLRTRRNAFLADFREYCVSIVGTKKQHKEGQKGGDDD